MINLRLSSVLLFRDVISGVSQFKFSTGDDAGVDLFFTARYQEHQDIKTGGHPGFGAFCPKNENLGTKFLKKSPFGTSPLKGDPFGNTGTC